MIILFNKPFNVLCQFTDETGRETLKSHIKQPNVYAAGRLDKDSEGLLILTDNPKFQHYISHPSKKVKKTYWIQVEGIPNEATLRALEAGVALKDGKTKPCHARIITPPDNIWERTPPVRSRKHIPTTWMEICLSEGKNRQVRRMSAAVGHPTLRLIRTNIGPFSLDQLLPGQSCSLTDVEAANLFTIDALPESQRRLLLANRKPQRKHRTRAESTQRKKPHEKQRRHTSDRSNHRKKTK